MIYSALNFWRSVPAIITYNAMPNKDKVTQDIKRNSFGSAGSNSVLLHRLLLKNTAFRNLFYLRVREYNRVLCKFLKLFYRPHPNFEIEGKIGGGLAIFHGHSTIVFVNSMGENCSVYQQVTLGRGKNINGCDIPVIGSNVNIFAGAKIIGGVHIGDNCNIGAGAV